MVGETATGAAIKETGSWFLRKTSAYKVAQGYLRHSLVVYTEIRREYLVNRTYIGQILGAWQELSTQIDIKI